MKYILLLVAIIVAGIVLRFNAENTIINEVNEANEVGSEQKTQEPAQNDLVTEKTPMREVAQSTLDLSNKGLTKTPSSVFEETGTVMLDLSHNRLEGSLQAEIRFLKNLKTLDLSYNNFTGVPAEIGQLSNLEVLNLSHNKITGLPYELGNLQNLKVLNLSGNAYSEYDLGIIKNALPKNTTIITQ